VDNQPDHRGLALRPNTTLFHGPPAYVPRTPWTPWRAVAGAVAVIGLSIAVGLALITLFEGGSVSDFPGGKTTDQAQALGLRFFALWQAGTILLTLAAAALFGGRLGDVLALHPAAGGWRSYAGALIILAILQVALSAVQYATRHGDLYVDLRPFVELARGEDWLLAAAIIGIGAPLSEELLFRGFLLSALAQTRLGFWGAAAVSSGLWTSLHAGYSTVGILEVFIIGLFFSWLLWRTGSLRVPIFCHAVYNSLIVLSLRLVELPGAG
jgi:membrane protease YdiL (CAAX protease family)